MISRALLLLGIVLLVGGEAADGSYNRQKMKRDYKSHHDESGFVEDSLRSDLDEFIKDYEYAEYGEVKLDYGEYGDVDEHAHDEEETAGVKWVGVYDVTGNWGQMCMRSNLPGRIAIIPASDLTKLVDGSWNAKEGEDYKTRANRLMEGECPPLPSLSPQADGSCFMLTVHPVTLNTAGWGAIAVFADQVPNDTNELALEDARYYFPAGIIKPVREFTVGSWKAPFDKTAMWLNKKINKPFFFSGDGVLALLLGIVGTVILAFTVTVLVSGEPEPEPTFWEKLKCTLSDVTKCDKFKFDFVPGRRGEPVTMNVNTDNSAEAYQVLQAFSATSGDTITTMLVSQLQAANYTGAMPTMITTVLNSVTDGGSSSGSSDSNTTMIAVAIVVAAALVLLVVLVVSALVYMYKLNKDQAPAAQAGAAPAPPMMGSVGVSMNPMHANEAKTPTAYTA